MTRFEMLIVTGSFALSVAAVKSAPSPAQSHETQAPASTMAMGNHVPTTLADWSKGARLYEGLGTFHRPVSTHTPEVQRYFDQGMRFLWAFNHDESTRSFARALELDPSCAMCAWGVAIQLPAVQFGPVGVGFLQTVRLNVVAYPPDPCSGILSITDLSGNPLVAPSQVNLTAGHATYIDLPGPNVLPKLGLHGEVLASFVPTPGAVPGMCIPSVEVYDQLTGRTRAILQNPGSAQVSTGPAN